MFDKIIERLRDYKTELLEDERYSEAGRINMIITHLLEDRKANPVAPLVMPKIAGIKQASLRELKLQDTIDDINNEEISRKDLWRSAYICGGIAIIDEIKSNFSE